MAVEMTVIAIGDPWRMVLVLHYIRLSPEPMLRRKLQRWKLAPQDALRQVAELVGQHLAR